ncbi:MAG: hypothetical protein BWY99_01682 [Synergistetes bacterium ADurb.BinA166]|nr:MAG: hypothetical protein BWY99_01682 [Synergistetes bacterium ADurb.BinA166]
MGRNKDDFLRECMTDPALNPDNRTPIDEFNRKYCVVCCNRDCSRSAAGGLAFDRRALNWKKDLFDEVPRAEEGDSSYDSIRRKVFRPAQESLSISTAQAPVVPVPTADARARFLPHVIEEAAPAPAPRQPAQSAHIPPPEYENTPFTQGMILPGGPPAAPPPTGGSEVVVQPGGTFVFGGDDE